MNITQEWVHNRILELIIIGGVATMVGAAGMAIVGLFSAVGILQRGIEVGILFFAFSIASWLCMYAAIRFEQRLR